LGTAGVWIEQAIVARAVMNTNVKAGARTSAPAVSENAMLAMTGIPMSLPLTRMSPDEIEQRIIRAYVQLACTPERDGSRIVTIVRFGALEARLTEVPEEQRLPGTPCFWLELYSHARRAVVDSCGCTELDEHELGQAVELIVSARHRTQGLQ
jgi:hypothetical protein